MIVQIATIVMSKKKELLAIGAAVASCAAAAAGYSYFKNENKPDQPQNQNIVGDLVKNTSAAFDDDDGDGDDNASINQKETDNLEGQSF